MTDTFHSIDAIAALFRGEDGPLADDGAILVSDSLHLIVQYLTGSPYS